MGEKEDREKAEKVAAARKRVAALQKKKKAAAAAAGGASGSKDGVPASPTKQDLKSQAEEDDTRESPETGEAQHDETSYSNGPQSPPATSETRSAFPNTDADEALFNDAINASQATTTAQSDENTPSGSPPLSSKSSHARQSSLSIRSKLRSTSFRQSNGPLLSPTAVLSPHGEDGDASGPDSVYRKQATRIEDLERENRRLMKEAETGEERWRRLETELEEVRERNAERSSRKGSAAVGESHEELDQLRSEIALLRSKHQQQRERTSSVSKGSRSGSNQTSTSPIGELEMLRKQADSKDAAISDMSLEISKLRSQVSEQVAGCETHGSQIEALQASLTGSEERFRKLELELFDSRKAVTRMSERSVQQGTEKTSRETRLKEMEREHAAMNTEKQDLTKQKQALDKKLDALGRLLREAEDRHTKRVKDLESESRRLREAKTRKIGKGGDEVDGDGDGVDELEDEDRARLERRIRELEGEVFELRRGVYHDRRRGLSTADDNGTLPPTNPAANALDKDRPSFEVDGFDDIDLSASTNSTARLRLQQQQAAQQQHSSFQQVLTSGLAAFYNPTSTSPAPDTAHSHTHVRARQDSSANALLEDFDDFDPSSFAAAAQRERDEEGKRMVEHVREVKRRLREEWKGYRLDLVESRRMMGGGGEDEQAFGEVFEI